MVNDQPNFLYNKFIPEPEMFYVVFCKNTQIRLAWTNTYIDKRTILTVAVAVDILTVILLSIFLCIV